MLKSVCSATRAPKSTAFHSSSQTLVCFRISWRRLVKAQIPGAHSQNFLWDETWEIAFLTGSQVMMMFLVQGPGFGKTLVSTVWVVHRVVHFALKWCHKSPLSSFLCFSFFHLKHTCGSLSPTLTLLFPPHRLPPYSHHPCGHAQIEFGHFLHFVVQLISRVRLFYDPMVCSPPGSSVHGISQARVLEWVSLSEMLWPLTNLNLETLEGNSE